MPINNFKVYGGYKVNVVPFIKTDIFFGAN